MLTLNFRPNISLSAFSESPIPITTSHTKYVPPHPQKGTSYHRYALLLVPQSHPTERVTISVPTEEERLGFNYRAFSEFYGLDAGKGGGAFMWREVWDETVSQIYRDTLSKWSLLVSRHVLNLFLLPQRRKSLSLVVHPSQTRMPN